MKAYNLKKFRKLVEDSDMVYGTVSLNAAVRVPVRIRKKTLLKYLDDITPVLGQMSFLYTQRQGPVPREIRP